MLHAVIRHRDGIGIEGAGFDDIGAGFEILSVYVGDHVWLGQKQQVVVAFDVHRMVGKSLAWSVVMAKQLGATIMRFAQFVALDHRAHRAVQDQDTLPDKRFYRVGSTGHGMPR